MFCMGYPAAYDEPYICHFTHPCEICEYDCEKDWREEYETD